MNLIVCIMQVLEAVREGGTKYSKVVAVVSTSFEFASDFYVNNTLGYDPTVTRLIDAYATTLEEFETNPNGGNWEDSYIDDRARLKTKPKEEVVRGTV